MHSIDFDSMNYIDYAATFIVLLSIAFGFYRGFITSVISLTGWIAAISLTYYFYPSVEEYLSDYIKSKLLIIILGSGSLLLIFLIIFGGLNALLYKMISGLKKSFVDRMFGLLFGVFRGVLIISFLFLCFSISLKLLSGKKAEVSEKDYPKTLTEAASFKLMKGGSTLLEDAFPESFHKRFAQIYDYISDKDINERFVQNSIDKLIGFASEQNIREINIMRQDLFEHESEDKIDIKTLKYLLENYKEKHNDGSVKKEVFTAKELARLEEITK
jgi:membrane protein required for colicin V production